jgi:hypothetical protein
LPPSTAPNFFISSSRAALSTSMRMVSKVLPSRSSNVTVTLKFGIGFNTLSSSPWS